MSTRGRPRTRLPNKLERIAALERHGLNTPWLLPIPVGTAFDEDLRRRLADAAAGERITVRTYHPTDETRYAKGPFAPEAPVDDAIRDAEEFSRGWNVLFQESVYPEDTLLTGNLILAADGSGAYELLAGPYRVRDVEDPPEGARDALRRARFSRPSDIVEAPIAALADRVLRSRLLDEVTSGLDEKIVLELTVQRRPIGKLAEDTIVWEWRPLDPARGVKLAPAPARRRKPAAAAPPAWGIGVARLPVPRVPDAHQLGSKGYGLARAAHAGLPVPPTAILAGRAASEWGAARAELAEVAVADTLVESAARAFPDRELTLAVRSSPALSLPGMLATVLDVPPLATDLRRAVEAVAASWETPHARAYRSAHRVPEETPLAIVLQPLVRFDRDARSGSGAGFTRDPRTGAPGPVLEFLPRAPGSDLVGGRRAPNPGDPRPPEDVASWAAPLERVFGFPQEYEFAVESGRSFLVQTRDARLTAAALVRSLHDLVEAGALGARRARTLLGPVRPHALLRRRLDTGGSTALVHGLGAVPGVAVGRLALSSAAVRRIRRRGDPALLVRATLDPSDYPLTALVAGIVTREGGLSAHGSVAALEAGVPTVVGCRELTVDAAAGVARFGPHAFEEGAWLSLEAADEGSVFEGRLDEREPEPVPGLAPEIVAWAVALEKGAARAPIQAG